MASINYTKLFQNIGYDLTKEVLIKWQNEILKRDIPIVKRKIKLLLELNSFKEFKHFGKIKNDGYIFLCEQTDFLKYTYNSDYIQLHLTELKILISLVFAIEGYKIKLKLNSLEGKNTLLVSGTNLVINFPELNQNDDYIEFDGESQIFRVGGKHVKMFYENKLLIFPKIGVNGFNSLFYDGDFIHYYFETLSETNNYDTVFYLIEDISILKKQLELLAKVKEILLERHEAVWHFIKNLIKYINWTDVYYLESSTDTRTNRGMITINPRLDALDDNLELIAWLAHGLYHEGKHIQFFETVLGEIPSNAVKEKNKLIKLGKDTIEIPCAWKGTPSFRSMSDHLLALQAFVPGLILAFDILAEKTKLSIWIRDHIEIDLRGVNGGIGSLTLGKYDLTESGLVLSETIVNDYYNTMIPSYTILNPQIRF